MWERRLRGAIRREKSIILVVFDGCVVRGEGTL